VLFVTSPTITSSFTFSFLPSFPSKSSIFIKPFLHSTCTFPTFTMYISISLCLLGLYFILAR
jgi:hypothetical protein